MKITALALVALTLAPTLALAEGCPFSKNVTASACGDNQTYDPALKACVTVSS